MNRELATAVQFLASSLLLCATAHLCRLLGSNRATAAMLLLLEVLGIATLGDWILALLSSRLPVSDSATISSMSLEAFT